MICIETPCLRVPTLGSDDKMFWGFRVPQPFCAFALHPRTKVKLPFLPVYNEWPLEPSRCLRKLLYHPTLQLTSRCMRRRPLCRRLSVSSRCDVRLLPVFQSVPPTHFQFWSPPLACLNSRRCTAMHCGRTITRGNNATPNLDPLKIETKCTVPPAGHQMSTEARRPRLPSV